MEVMITMEYSTYAETLSGIEEIFFDETIDEELGYPEDHEYYEDDEYVASSLR